MSSRSSINSLGTDSRRSANPGGRVACDARKRPTRNPRGIPRSHRRCARFLDERKIASGRRKRRTLRRWSEFIAGQDLLHGRIAVGHLDMNRTGAGPYRLADEQELIPTDTRAHLYRRSKGIKKPPVPADEAPLYCAFRELSAYFRIQTAR